MQVYIQLTQGKQALVDKADFEWLSQWKWYYIKDGYAVRSDYSQGRTPRQVKMHRQIMNEPEGLQVDHKNTNKLDNRRENLRVATVNQNQQNSSLPKNNTSGYKGVSKPRRGLGWIASIQRQYLGYYKTPEEAALAYNIEATKRFGEFARLNKV